MATPFHIRYAAHCIRNGGVIVYPTETVYGLGCDPNCREAVERIFAIKQRPPGKGMIIVAASLEQLETCIHLPGQLDSSAMIAGTVPTSWVLPANEDAPRWLVTNGTIAVRVSTHPLVIELCTQLGHPITSTSANRSGRRTATTPLGLHRDFDGKVDAFLIPDEGQRRHMSGRPSQVRALHSNTIYRAG